MYLLKKNSFEFDQVGATTGIRAVLKKRDGLIYGGAKRPVITAHPALMGTILKCFKSFFFFRCYIVYCIYEY